MATNPLPQAPWGEYVPRVAHMTVEQFEQFPMEEGWIYELHEGRLVSMPGPGRIHGQIQTKLTLILSQYLTTHQLGALTGTCFYNLPLPGNREELLCHDLSYVLPAREAGIVMRGSYPILVPDLVIEISSPCDTRPKVAQKAAIYLQAGVRLLWVAWPNAKPLMSGCPCHWQALPQPCKPAMYWMACRSFLASRIPLAMYSLSH